MNRWTRLFSLALALSIPAAAGSLDRAALQADFNRLAASIDGRVGVCARDRAGIVCTNGDQRFPLQSVMKLMVAMAVMDNVDRKGWSLAEPITVRKQDFSVFQQPMASLVTADGYHTTVGDLVRRAIVDSDSTAADILIDKLGGPAAVQSWLDRKHLAGVRLDRDEKQLQTEIIGMEWKPEYVDAAVFQKAIDSVPRPVHDQAYRKYLTDPRDTATPKGMAQLLQRLAQGKLLSQASTQHLLDVMAQTATGTDRLKAGVPAGWKIAHKTGTSGTWEGMTAATNDEGILTAPDGEIVSIAVFVADSRASAADRAAVTARLAAATVRHYHEAVEPQGASAASNKQ